MKVVYDDNEKDVLQDIYDKFPESHLFDTSDPDKEYSLNFKITNPCIAEYILRGLLFDRLNDFDIGIQLTSINMSAFCDITSLRQRLHDAIDEAVR